MEYTQNSLDGDLKIRFNLEEKNYIKSVFKKHNIKLSKSIREFLLNKAEFLEKNSKK